MPLRAMSAMPLLMASGDADDAAIYYALYAADAYFVTFTRFDISPLRFTMPPRLLFTR